VIRNFRPLVYRPSILGLHASIVSVHGSIVSVHGPFKRLYFYFSAVKL
jgi:hypothetical protein